MRPGREGGVRLVQWVVGGEGVVARANWPRRRERRMERVGAMLRVGGMLTLWWCEGGRGSCRGVAAVVGCYLYLKL